MSLSIPKKRDRIVSPRYTAWIREQPCAVTGRYGVECAHCESRGRAVGHDTRTIPLTPGMHREQHTRHNGMIAFLAAHGVDAEALIESLQSRFCDELHLAIPPGTTFDEVLLEAGLATKHGTRKKQFSKTCNPKLW